MNNSTKVRIRVPKHLYESIQAELNKKQGQMNGKPMEEEINTGAKMAAEKLMAAISSGDPFWTGIGLVGGATAALIAAGNAENIKKKLAGWWQGLTADVQQDLNKKLDDVDAEGSEAPMAEEKSEVVGKVDQLAEAIKKVLDKKKEAKKKAAEAEKEKAAKDKEKEKAAKEKEAEAKKKAAEAKKKADAKKK
jgi:hypothetical protein